MSDVNYAGFPFVDTNDFVSVAFDCTKTDDGYYYLTLSYFKQFADDETGDRAEGLIFSTNIRALTLVEIDARCGSLYRAGLFDGLHIDPHGSLFDSQGVTIGPICWNHIHENGEHHEHESVPVTGATTGVTLQ